MNEINKENILPVGTLLMSNGVMYEVAGFVAEYHIKETNPDSQSARTRLRYCVPVNHMDEYQIIEQETTEIETNMDGIEL